MSRREPALDDRHCYQIVALQPLLHRPQFRHHRPIVISIPRTIQSARQQATEPTHLRDSLDFSFTDLDIAYVNVLVSYPIRRDQSPVSAKAKPQEGVQVFEPSEHPTGPSLSLATYSLLSASSLDPTAYTVFASRHTRRCTIPIIFLGFVSRSAKDTDATEP